MVNTENKLQLPLVERLIYKKTFLYSVEFFFHFSKALAQEEFDLFQKILSNEGWKKINRDKGSNLLFTRNDSGIVLTSQEIQIILSIADYNTFETWCPWLVTMNKTLGDNAINFISIIKSNHYRIKQEDSKGENWIKNALLSSDYLSNCNKAPDNANRFVASLDDGVFGFSQFDISLENGVYTLQLNLACAEKVGKNDFKEQLTRLNNIIFRLWHWAVSKNVIKMMEG